MVSVILMVDGIGVTWVLSSAISGRASDVMMCVLYFLYFYFSAMLPVAHTFRKEEK